MNKEANLLFILLRAGLWEKEPEELSLFPLPPETWAEIFKLSRMHTVTGIVYRGILRLPDDCLPPWEMLAQWVAQAERIERMNRTMNDTLAELYALFDSKGWLAVLQKGQGVARFYEEPLLRECGDIDLYFPDRKAQDEAAEWLRKEGCQPEKAPDGSLHYRYNGIVVEHHPELIDLQNPFLHGYLSRLIAGEGFGKAVLAEGRVTVVVPSPLLDLLLLNTHIMKHAIGRGVGLRQLCDIAHAYHSLHGQFDPETLRFLYIKTGISHWSSLLHAFLVDYIGLSSDRLPYDEHRLLSSQPLLDIVLRGGNFGQHADGQEKTRAQRGWIRKLHTARSFCRNLHFAATYASGESFWTAARLLRGQFRNNLHG